jgi:endonuclease/exonuclease/phosphatase family metal-dependent hydrolase
MAGLIVLVLVAVVLALAARDTRESVAVPRSGYTLVQMNLCLSGIAACYPRVQYPLGVRVAADVIRDSRADAVTLDEVCRADVDRIAAETGFHARFAPMASRGFPIRCVNPGGRGVYGIAVLTRANITASVGHPYADQDDVEQRRWLCATTDETGVCATHLDIRGWARVDGVNDAQCDEFRQVLQRLAADHPVIAGGDMNRDDPCPAPGMQVRTDSGAGQDPGKQHVYATTDFVAPETRIVPMAHTDHDALVVTSRLKP